MRKVAFAALWLALFFGCTGLWHPGAAGGGINLNAYCDKRYSGDPEGGTIVGVYRCGENFRLVFDSPTHNDYYLTSKGDFFTSCPIGQGNEECNNLLEKCKADRFINLCR